MTSVSDAPSARLDDEAVIDFLVRNKDFFGRHPELIDALEIPHDSGNATSLVERQVAILRERNIDLRRRLAELMQTAGDNDRLFAKTRSLTLALMDVRTLADLDAVLSEQLVDGFEADHAMCWVLDAVLDSHAHIVGLERAAPLPTPRLFSQQEPTCGACRPEEYAALFATAAPKSPGSAALVPMHGDGLEATLAIGSVDPSRFSGEMGTLFLAYIGAVLGRTLLRLKRGR